MCTGLVGLMSNCAWDRFAETERGGAISLPWSDEKLSGTGAQKLGGVVALSPWFLAGIPRDYPKWIDQGPEDYLTKSVAQVVLQ